MQEMVCQLKTWLQLQVSETTTYSKVREMILLYDASTTRWSEQMVLGSDNATASGDGPVPMEIDRIQQKGKSKGKGKSQDKGYGKGQTKGKQKGKDSKGKAKGSDQKGSKGNAGERSKGKGKGDGKICYICGRSGHFARDCWQGQGQVRNVASEVTQVPTTQGSPMSSTSGMTSVSQQPQSGTQTQMPTQATQMRVVSDDVHRHDDLIFDMRCASPSSLHGDVHVVHFYMGDSGEDEVACNGFVRTIGSCNDPDGEHAHTILLDSGADEPARDAVGRLHDAQGREIPVEAVQDMEIKLKDITGKSILLRERVAVSSMFQKPILCFGHLLESGWSVDGVQQALAHSAGAHVPSDLQNKPMAVYGEIRMLREDASASGCFHVRAIQADVMDYVVNGSVGWELDEYGRGIGRHFSESFKILLW
jgi:hypothetical protein